MECPIVASDQIPHLRSVTNMVVSERFRNTGKPLVSSCSPEPKLIILSATKLLLWRKDRLEAELRLVNEYLESFPIPGEQVKSNYDVKNSRDDRVINMGNEKSVKPCAGGNIHLNTTEENKDKEDESDQKMEDMFDEKSDHNQDMLANRFDVYGDGRPETDVVYWTDGLSIRRTWKDGKWFYETCTDL